MEGFGPHQTPTLEKIQLYKDKMSTNDWGGGIGIDISWSHHI